ncbi:MAG: hypothetical protein R2877_06440 [Bdellovibrionota bacterium]
MKPESFEDLYPTLFNDVERNSSIVILINFGSQGQVIWIYFWNLRSTGDLKRINEFNEKIANAEKFDEKFIYDYKFRLKNTFRNALEISSKQDPQTLSEFLDKMILWNHMALRIQKAKTQKEQLKIGSQIINIFPWVKDNIKLIGQPIIFDSESDVPGIRYAEFFNHFSDYTFLFPPFYVDRSLSKDVLSLLITSAQVEWNKVSFEIRKEQWNKMMDIYHDLLHSKSKESAWNIAVKMIWGINGKVLSEIKGYYLGINVDEGQNSISERDFISRFGKTIGFSRSEVAKHTGAYERPSQRKYGAGRLAAKKIMDEIKLHPYPDSLLGLYTLVIEKENTAPKLAEFVQFIVGNQKNANVDLHIKTLFQALLYISIQKNTDPTISEEFSSAFRSIILELFGSEIKKNHSGMEGVGAVIHKINEIFSETTRYFDLKDPEFLKVAKKLGYVERSQASSRIPTNEEVLTRLANQKTAEIVNLPRSVSNASQANRDARDVFQYENYLVENYEQFRALIRRHNEKYPNAEFQIHSKEDYLEKHANFDYPSFEGLAWSMRVPLSKIDFDYLFAPEDFNIPTRRNSFEFKFRPKSHLEMRNYVVEHNNMYVSQPEKQFYSTNDWDRNALEFGLEFSNHISQRLGHTDFDYYTGKTNTIRQRLHHRVSNQIAFRPQTHGQMRYFVLNQNEVNKKNPKRQIHNYKDWNRLGQILGLEKASQVGNRLGLLDFNYYTGRTAALKEKRTYRTNLYLPKSHQEMRSFLVEHNKKYEAIPAFQVYKARDWDRVGKKLKWVSSSRIIRKLGFIDFRFLFRKNKSLGEKKIYRKNGEIKFGPSRSHEQVQDYVMSLL